MTPFTRALPPKGGALPPSGYMEAILEAHPRFSIPNEVIERLKKEPDWDWERWVKQ